MDAVTVDYSRDALRARLGAEVYAIAEKAAADAPPPSAAKVESVRRILAPAVTRAMAARPKVARPALERAA